MQWAIVQPVILSHFGIWYLERSKTLLTRTDQDIRKLLKMETPDLKDQTKLQNSALSEHHTEGGGDFNQETYGRKLQME